MTPITDAPFTVCVGRRPLDSELEPARSAQRPYLSRSEAGGLVGLLDPERHRHRVDEVRGIGTVCRVDRLSNDDPVPVDHRQIETPAAKVALAAETDASGTKSTLVPTRIASALTRRSAAAWSSPTTATFSADVVLVWSTGITMAPATTRRMTTVPTRKIRPRTRSRISRAATRRTAPGESPNETIPWRQR